MFIDELVLTKKKIFEYCHEEEKNILWCFAFLNLLLHFSV